MDRSESTIAGGPSSAPDSSNDPLGAFARPDRPLSDEIEKFMSRVGLEHCNVLGLPPAECRPDMNEDADRAAAKKLSNTLIIWPLTASDVRKPLKHILGITARAIIGYTGMMSFPQSLGEDILAAATYGQRGRTKKQWMCFVRSPDLRDDH